MEPEYTVLLSWEGVECSGAIGHFASTGGSAGAVIV